MSNYYTTPQADVGLLLRKAIVALTDADIKATSGGTSLFEIVPAPGVGKVLIPISSIIIFNFTAGAYTNIHATDAALDIRVGATMPGSAFAENSATRTRFTAIFNSTNHAVAQFPPDASPVDGAHLGVLPHNNMNTVENQPINLEIYNGNGALTGGHADNTLKVTVLYAILDT